jgi:hypothetical protein
MSDNRRSFIKKTSSLAAATTLGGLGSLVKANEYEQSIPCVNMQRTQECS